MKNNSIRTIKAVIANMMVAVMIMLSVLIAPTTTASAAAKPALAKTLNILEGKKFNLIVDNKIKGSTYVWSTSNKKIATVTQKGTVKGISKGTATISCKVTAKADTYKLSCKVTVMKAAYGIKIKNKVTALALGQVYDFNRKLSPSTSTEKTIWTSSDSTIAAPDKNGKVTALKLGKVTITAKSTSGYTDSVTFTVVDKDGTVSNQKELEALLGSGVSVITIKTQDTVNLTIPAGDYSNQKLVVNAPKADITNYGKFGSVVINEIKADTWHEEAVGNLLQIFAAKSRVIVGTNAKVNIEVSEQGATMTIVNNGVVEKIVIEKSAAVDISGTSKTHVPVEINVPNITLTSSVPLTLDCQQKATIVLLAGAEGTTVQADTQALVPEIKGSVSVSVTVGTGAQAQTAEVTGTPVATTTPTAGAGGGTVSGGDSSAPTPTPVITSVTNGLTTTYTLAKPISDLASVTVTYSTLPIPYTMDQTMLNTLVDFLSNSNVNNTLTKWHDITTTLPKTYTSGGITQLVDVSAGAVGYTKTVHFVSPLNRTYTVAVDAPNRTVTVTNQDPGSVTYTITASADLKTLTITKSAATSATLTFTPTFK